MTQPLCHFAVPRRCDLELVEASVSVAPAGASAPQLHCARFAADGVARVEPWAVEVEVKVGARDSTAGTLDVAIRNRGATPCRVESVELVLRARLRCDGSLRFLRNGWQSWSFTGTRELDIGGEEPFPSGAWLRGIYHCVGEPEARWSGWHESETFALFGPTRGGPACLLGGLETGRACVVVHLLREPPAAAEQIVRVVLEQRLEVLLEAAEQRVLEALFVAVAEDPRELLERFADTWGKLAEARCNAPYQTGWCSWYHFFHRVAEDDVRRNLDAIAEDDRLPVDVIQIDDGYQSAIGDWLRTNEKFPRGLAPLVAEIRAAGFTAGLWTAPFAASAESAVLRRHPDWALGDESSDNGLLCGMYNPEWSADGRVYSLDTSRDDVLRHLEDLYRALAEMGFAYQKLDFLYMAAQQGRARDATLTRAQRLRRGLAAIRRGVGDAAFLLGCGCPLGPAVGIVDGMRIGPDVAPSWEPDSALAIPGLAAVLPSTHSAIRSTVNRLFLHRRLWLNDPDCLMARSAQTHLRPHEVRALATAVAVGGGAMVFSDDVAVLDADTRGLIRAVLATGRAVDAGRSASLLDPLAADDVRTIAAEIDGAVVSATINLGDSRVPLPADSGCWSVARDLLGDVPGMDDAELEAHASVVRYRAE